jgi:hypothetical protein
MHESASGYLSGHFGLPSADFRKDSERNFRPQGASQWYDTLLPGMLRRGTRAMPIKRLLKDSKLAPDEIENLFAAFRKALRLCQLVDRNDPLAELIARKCIEVGASGVRDASQIAEITVKQLRIS